MRHVAGEGGDAEDEERHGEARENGDLHAEPADGREDLGGIQVSVSHVLVLPSHVSPTRRKAAPPPPPPRTKWTRRVPHPVLSGHAASLTPY
jgi:hypothetical protein